MSDTVGFVREDGKPEGYVFGRPTSYRPDMCQKVVEWGREGKSKTWMAASLNISRDTFNRWERENKDFSDAITLAMAYSQMWWEDKGQAALDAQIFQASMWSRSMAARFPEDWRETQRQEQTGPNGGPIQVTEVKRVIVDPNNSDA